MILPAELSIRELARRAGISRMTAWRRVRALHARHGGVLVDVGLEQPRVSTRRFLEVSHLLGTPVALASELDFVEERVARLEQKLGMQLSFF